MSDETFFQDLFDDQFEPTERPFDQVFRIDKTELGLQITALQKTKVKDTELYLGKSVIADSITLDNKAISEFQNAILTGQTHKDSKVFHITGYKTPIEGPKGKD